MNGAPHLRPARYSTDQVALILGAEVWRIKNFSTKTYGMEPTVKAGGRGKRQFYDFEALLRLAVANELYDSGFGPDGIKDGVHAVDAERTISRWLASAGKRANGATPFLTLMRGRNRTTDKWERVWHVLPFAESKSTNADILESGSAAAWLDLAALWTATVRRVTELEGEGRL